MVEPTNTVSKNALPDEMVTRATKAMLRADGWTAQEIADQYKKGEATTLKPFTAEILAEVALTAAGVPGLLAEVERLRKALSSCITTQERTLPSNRKFLRSRCLVCGNYWDSDDGGQEYHKVTCPIKEVRLGVCGNEDKESQQ